MGSGVAAQIRVKYPIAYRTYMESGHKLATVSIIMVYPKLFIANAVTQQYYGRNPDIKYVSYTAISECFKSLTDVFGEETKFHIPKIGAGLANGDWSIISELINNATIGYDVTCWELE